MRRGKASRIQKKQKSLRRIQKVQKRDRHDKRKDVTDAMDVTGIWRRPVIYKLHWYSGNDPICPRSVGGTGKSGNERREKKSRVAVGMQWDACGGDHDCKIKITRTNYNTQKPEETTGNTAKSSRCKGGRKR